MHFIKTLSALLLAANAAIASPLDIDNSVLVKRVNGDGGAGAYIEPPKNVAFVSVAGTVTMPDISKAKEKEIVSYWIGIDGINTDRVIQAGFDATRGSGSSATYQAFYEWFPEKAKFIDSKDFAVKKGDVVAVTLTTSKEGTAAKAVFDNKTTGKSYTTPEFNTPSIDDDAKGINAEWVVEQPPNSKLANFGEIIFTHCSAADKDKKSYNLKGGKTFNFVSGGKTLAEASIKNDSEVHVKYKG